MSGDCEPVHAVTVVCSGPGKQSVGGGIPIYERSRPRRLPLSPGIVHFMTVSCRSRVIACQGGIRCHDSSVIGATLVVVTVVSMLFQDMLVCICGRCSPASVSCQPFRTRLSIGSVSRTVYTSSRCYCTAKTTYSLVLLEVV